MPNELAYDPNLPDNALVQPNGSPYQQPASYEDALQHLYNLTGIPDLLSAYQAANRGEYLPALGQGAAAGAAMLPALKPFALAPLALAMKGAKGGENALLGALPEVNKLMPIRAYHGSPYDFDAFDASRIGTGQGAQTYGYGLYTAQAEPVAESYIGPAAKWKYGTTNAQTIYDRLNNQSLERGLDNEGWEKLNAQRGFWEKVVLGRSPRSIIEDARINPDEYGDAELAFINSLNPDRFKRLGGHMYEVNINAHPDSFLHWDKTITEQPEQVRQSLQRAGWAIDRMGDRPGSEIIRQYDEVAPGGEFAANKLRDAGISGIKYLDQGSRDAGDGTYNYVVFDPKMIEIIRKYGLPGLISGGAMTLGGNADAATHLMPVDHDPFAPEDK